MNRKAKILPFVLATKGLVNLVFGLGMATAPHMLMAIYGANLGGIGVPVARLFGAALLGIGAVQFWGRNMEDSAARTLLVGTFAAADLLGLAISVSVQLSGQLNQLGWAIVALYAFAGLGFSFGFLLECSRKTDAKQVQS